MAVESVQCPKCGAPLSVEPDREHTYCSYCGAGLKLTQGVSGHPMAVLDDIKSDTSILAKEATLKRSVDEISEKQMRQMALVAARGKEQEAVPRGFLTLQAVLCAVVGICLALFGIIPFVSGGGSRVWRYDHPCWTLLPSLSSETKRHTA